jgi:uncharacterized protein (TIGR01244 family)
MRTFIAASAIAVAGIIASEIPAAAQATRQEMRGVRTLTIVDPTVACAGATDASAMPEIAKRGYATVINLRLASEPGAAVDEARAAAARAGIRYVHLPFNVSKPDPAVVDRFIAAVTDEANLPVFIHGGSANPVAALWMIKRVVIDKWDLARAQSEARQIGLSSPAMRDFAVAEIARRSK